MIVSVAMADVVKFHKTKQSRFVSNFGGIARLLADWAGTKPSLYSTATQAPFLVWFARGSSNCRNPAVTRQAQVAIRC